MCVCKPFLILLRGQGKTVDWTCLPLSYVRSRTQRERAKDARERGTRVFRTGWTYERDLQTFARARPSLRLFPKPPAKLSALPSERKTEREKKCKQTEGNRLISICRSISHSFVSLLGSIRIPACRNSCRSRVHQGTSSFVASLSAAFSTDEERPSLNSRSARKSADAQRAARDPCPSAPLRLCRAVCPPLCISACNRQMYACLSTPLLWRVRLPEGVELSLPFFSFSRVFCLPRFFGVG